MKLVIAVICPDRLEAVREALPEPDAYIFYVNLVCDVREPVPGTYRGGNYNEPRARLRVEIVVVNEMLLDEVIKAVLAAATSEAHTGISNGNVFVLPLEQWIRIPEGNVHRIEHPSATVNAVCDRARS